VRRGILALLALALSIWATQRAFTQAVTDFRWHAAAAAELSRTGQPATPHFLFQALLVAAHAAWPALDWVNAGLALAVVCQVVLALLVASLLEAAVQRPQDGRGPVLAGGLALALVIAGPVNILSWSDRSLYLGYLSPSTHHNPTATLLRPLALALFCRVSAYSFADRGLRARAIVLDAGLSVAAVLAKPSQALALVPAVLALVAGRLARRKPVSWRPLTLGFLIPTLAVLAAQYASLRGEGAGVGWAPLAVMSLFPGDKLARLLLSLLFPLSVLALHPAALKRDGTLGLAWMSFGWAALWVYGFAETGERLTNANLLWTGQVALFVLFFASVRFLVSEASGDWRRRVPCWTAFVLHLAGGVYFCIHPAWW
jgi:hypothetical protein